MLAKGICGLLRGRAAAGAEAEPESAGGEMLRSCPYSASGFGCQMFSENSVRND